MQKCLQITILLFIFSAVYAQEDKYKSGFIPPLDIPMYLSGNFAETRGGHFHTGIDVKTLGRTGLPVKAIGDGYVSRVYVSPSGYGKAIYINHPNGMTSVYGHLDQFSEKINAVVKDLQYLKESFRLNYSFNAGEIKIKQGEVIAKSGNTGSSGGPHLHFEIRRTNTEHPLNPLHFGVPVKDKMRPQILGIKVFPVNDMGLVNNKNEAKYYPAVFYADAYHLKSSPKIKVAGEIGIGIETFDYLTGDWSKCGTYSADIYVDDVLIFCWKMDSLAFDENRYINTVCDYASRTNNRQWIYKMFKDEPNNRFSNYCNSDNGIISFTDAKTHKIKLIVHDVYGNRSDIEFRVQSEKASAVNKKAYTNYMPWEDGGQYAENNIQIEFPPKALYADIDLKVEKESGKNLYSDIFTIHKTDVAVFKPYILKLKPAVAHKTQKLYIAAIGKSGKPTGFFGNTYDDGWLKGSAREFGSFAIARDSIAPDIRSLDVKDGQNIRGKKQLRFKIKDGDSGIVSYRAEIDGDWVLMEYEPKKDMLTYNFDPSRIEKSMGHNLFLKVEDNVGNVGVFLCSFTW